MCVCVFLAGLRSVWHVLPVNDHVLALEEAGFLGAPPPPPHNRFPDSAFWCSLVTRVGGAALRVHLLLSFPSSFPAGAAGLYCNTGFELRGKFRVYVVSRLLYYEAASSETGKRFSSSGIEVLK